MADQVIDLSEAGIPYDIAIARAESESFSLSAAQSASRAESSAAAAGREATAAAASAEQARQYAEQRVDAITVSENPPTDDNRWNGKVWIAVDGSDILNLNVWDTSDPGNALRPDVDLTPAADLVPADAGAWQEYNFPTA